MLIIYYLYLVIPHVYTLQNIMLYMVSTYDFICHWKKKKKNRKQMPLHKGLDFNI